MLILEVGLSMVTNDPISIGRWSTRSRIGRCDLSLQVVVQSVEETFAQVHVADWVDTLGEVDRAGDLAIAMGPVVLNALHVPLVDDNDNFVTLGVINLPKQLLILLIDHDLLELGEVQIGRLNKPVHLGGVQAFFCEGRRAHLCQLVVVRVGLILPAGDTHLPLFEDVFWHVETRLVCESLPSVLAQFGAHKLNVGANLLCGFASELNLQTWSHGHEISHEAEVITEQCIVDAQSEQL